MAHNKEFLMARMMVHQEQHLIVSLWSCMPLSDAQALSEYLAYLADKIPLKIKGSLGCCFYFSFLYQRC